METACGLAFVPAMFGVTVTSPFWMDWMAEAGAATTSVAARAVMRSAILRMDGSFRQRGKGAA